MITGLISHVAAWTVPTNVLLWILRYDDSPQAKRYVAQIKPSWLPPAWKLETKGDT